MAIITLTTDWGLRDHYLAGFKADLLSRNPSLRIIDISHDIEHFNILEASFIVQNCFRRFPPGTVHYLGLSGNAFGNNPAVNRHHLLLKSEQHYFMGIDSGIFSLILEELPFEAVRLPITSTSSRDQVHALYMHSLALLWQEENLANIGSPHAELIKSFSPQPSFDQNSIRGNVIYIDSFDNAIINIRRELFERERNNRPFRIQLRKSAYTLEHIVRNYDDVEVGEIMAFFNKRNYLEIAINRDKASSLLGMKLMDPVRIEFL